MESASSQRHSLSDFPIGALSHVSSYLPSLPRALLAVALNNYDTDSTAIVGDQRDVLDFGDIEKELAVKLTDDDIKHILLSIDAINNLKTLRLTNLLNITGIGLEPLRGSTVIEKIDMSLVGDHEICDVSPAPPISCTDVLPILDSIIDMGGACSLRLLIFPKEWRKERDANSEFHAFLVRYNELLCNRVVFCLNCDDNLEEGEMMRMENYEYGTQNFTCYDCMKHYCHDCSEEDEGEIYCMSDVCRTCNRRYCLHCSRPGWCGSCNKHVCVECMDLKQCAKCGDNICLDCVSERRCHNNCCEEKDWCNACAWNGLAFVPCYHCDKDYCIGCSGNSNAIHSIDYCNVCEVYLCGQCRVSKCKDGSNCLGCYRFTFPALLEAKERQRQKMQAEIDKQKKDNNELKEENSELKRKLEDVTGGVAEE